MIQSIHIKFGIDSGANVSVLGRNVIEFLERAGIEPKKYLSSVRTADGSIHYGENSNYGKI